MNDSKFKCIDCGKGLPEEAARDYWCLSCFFKMIEKSEMDHRHDHLNSLLDPPDVAGG